MPAGIIFAHTPQSQPVGQSMSVGNETLQVGAMIVAEAPPGGNDQPGGFGQRRRQRHWIRGSEPA